MKARIARILLWISVVLSVILNVVYAFLGRKMVLLSRQMIEQGDYSTELLTSLDRLKPVRTVLAYPAIWLLPAGVLVVMLLLFSEPVREKLTVLWFALGAAALIALLTLLIALNEGRFLSTVTVDLIFLWHVPAAWLIAFGIGFLIRKARSRKV